MSRVTRINLVAAALAIGLAVFAMSVGQPDSRVSPRHVDENQRYEVHPVLLADGRHAIPDHSGALVPLANYQRIASGSTVSDWLLTELCEPDRVVAITRRSATSAPWRHRFAGKRKLASLTDIEAILALEPDLLLMDSFGDPRRVARLREHGLTVFDLGQMRGLASIEFTAERIGALCGRLERGRKFGARMRQATTLANDIPLEQRPRGMYLSPYGDKLFGGTRGTGYHDLLRHAGVIDAAAERFSDFPEYSAEHVLDIDPDIIVTRDGMGAALCRHAGLSSLRACHTRGAIIELDSFAVDDPGLGLIESIESLFQAVHRHDATTPGQPPATP